MIQQERDHKSAMNERNPTRAGRNDAMKNQPHGCAKGHRSKFLKRMNPTPQSIERELMRRKSTSSTKSQTTPRLPSLTEQQRTALEAELAGKPTREAAELAGVTRQTVSEWRNHHSAYRAARNVAIWDLLGDITMKVRSELLPLAFADLLQDLKSDDVKVRQRARSDLLRYERQLPSPPMDDPDREKDALAWRQLRELSGDTVLEDTVGP